MFPDPKHTLHSAESAATPIQDVYVLDADSSKSEHLVGTTQRPQAMQQPAHQEQQQQRQNHRPRPSFLPQGQSVRVVQTTMSKAFLGSILESDSFQNLVVAAIVLNSILLGMATFDFVTEEPSVRKWFDAVDFAFLIFFTAEIGLQALYRGAEEILSGGWLTFDVLVIALSWVFDSIQVIRAFRIIRALRVITRMPHLRHLVEALIAVRPKMFAIGLLLVIVDYIFAVMFTHLFKDMYMDGLTTEDYFSRLDTTTFTLFQIMTLDGWSTIARQVLVVYPWAWIPFVTFVAISSFIVVNLVIAVICNAVSSSQYEYIDQKFEDGMDSIRQSIRMTYSHQQQYHQSPRHQELIVGVHSESIEFDDHPSFQPSTPGRRHNPATGPNAEVYMLNQKIDRLEAMLQQLVLSQQRQELERQQIRLSGSTSGSLSGAFMGTGPTSATTARVAARTVGGAMAGTAEADGAPLLPYTPPQPPSATTMSRHQQDFAPNLPPNTALDNRTAESNDETVFI